MAPQEDRRGLMGAQTGRVGTWGLVFPSEVALRTPVPARRVLRGQESVSAARIKGWKSVIAEVANGEFRDTDLSN